MSSNHKKESPKEAVETKKPLPVIRQKEIKEDNMNENNS